MPEPHPPDPESRSDARIDPDPFLLAALVLQGAAVILQFVQIYRQHPGAGTSPVLRRGRDTQLEELKKALRTFDDAIGRAERTVRRGSRAPDKEMYEAGFRISLGVLNLHANITKEYHENLATICTDLSALVRWVGNIIAHDPDLARELGGEVLEQVGNAADRLNALMEKGGEIQAVLHEAKLVRAALEGAIKRRLEGENS